MKVYIVLFSSVTYGDYNSSARVCSSYERAKKMMDDELRVLRTESYDGMGFVLTEGEWYSKIAFDDNYYDEITIIEEDVQD